MVWRRSFWCVTAMMAVVAAPGGLAARELTAGQAQLYHSLSLSPPTADQMTVCYSFSCTRRWQLDFTAADRKRLTDLLATGKASAAAERKAVQQAVVWFERRIGPIIGTDKRIANADIRSFDAAHNFDCFDTTRNTTSLLLVMQEWGLFRHHVVGDPRFRGNILFGQLPHNTAVLIDRATNVGWAVDMWPRGYAELPDVMTVEQWLSEN
jgi:hypothetical protein